MAAKEKMVKIKLFKDNHEYKRPLFVSVNNRDFMIQRGVEVEVPECVANVLRDSEKQDAEAIRFMQELQKGAEF